MRREPDPPNYAMLPAAVICFTLAALVVFGPLVLLLVLQATQ